MLIRSVTLVKSIESAKPRKARVINFKARAKPKARALKNTGLFSITTSNSIEHGDTKDFSDCSTTMVKKEEALEPFEEDNQTYNDQE